MIFVTRTVTIQTTHYVKKKQDYVASYIKSTTQSLKTLMFLFLEGNRDNLEQTRKEIADIKEKLDTLMNRLPLEERKLRMEGKIYLFLAGRGEGLRRRLDYQPLFGKGDRAPPMGRVAQTRESGRNRA